MKHRTLFVSARAQIEDHDKHPVERGYVLNDSDVWQLATNVHDAYDAICSGASLIQLYTALVFEGLGVVRAPGAVQLARSRRVAYAPRSSGRRMLIIFSACKFGL